MRGAPALYLVTDRRALPAARADRAAGALALAEALAAALSRVDPARVAVQLREQDLNGRELYELGRAALAVCRAHDVPMLLNDRLDVALALGADGVHLGGGSLSAADARRVWPKGLIGVSCHSPEELRERAAGADFAVWGPVFPTPSKAGYGAPVGTARLSEALAVGLPLVALGGVDEANVRGLRTLGFAGAACIRAVFSAQDPGAAAARLLASFDAA